MAEITSYTAAKIDEIEGKGIESAAINESGHLILTRYDDTTIDAGVVVADPTPAGTVSMFGGATPPDGWLLCDGTAVSRTIFAALFAAIGTAFGSGNGSTTFNLPNVEGRYPRMQEAALGTAAGTDGHTHTIDAHTHTGPSHVHAGSSHDHNLEGGSVVAHARSRIVTGAGPNLHIQRISVPEWTDTHHGDTPNSGSSSDTTTNGTAVAGMTATGGTGNTGSAGTGTTSSNGYGANSTTHRPAYLNFNFIIKT